MALAPNWPLYSAITMTPVWGPSVKSSSWGLLCLPARVCRKVDRNQNWEMYQLFHSFNWERRFLMPVRRPVPLTRLGCTLNMAEYIGPSAYQGREQTCSNCFSWREKNWVRIAFPSPQLEAPRLLLWGRSSRLRRNAGCLEYPVHRLWTWDSALTGITLQCLVRRWQ